MYNNTNIQKIQAMISKFMKVIFNALFEITFQKFRLFLLDFFQIGRDLVAMIKVIRNLLKIA